MTSPALVFNSTNSSPKSPTISWREMYSEAPPTGTPNSQPTPIGPNGLEFGSLELNDRDTAIEVAQLDAEASVTVTFRFPVARLTSPGPTDVRASSVPMPRGSRTTLTGLEEPEPPPPLNMARTFTSCGPPTSGGVMVFATSQWTVGVVAPESGSSIDSRPRPEESESAVSGMFAQLPPAVLAWKRALVKLTSSAL